jgi:hypothetical protein
MKPTPLIADLGAIHVTMAAARWLREEGIELDHLLLRYQHGDWDEDEPTTVESVFAARHGLRVGTQPLCLAVRARRPGS